MVFVWLAASRVGVVGLIAEGSSSLAMARKFRQQADVVVPVIWPTCPRTVLICLQLQRAIAGLRAALAPESQWPDHRLQTMSRD